MASYAQKGDAAAYSRDAIISNMLSEVGDALEGSLECCPALPTVLKLAHRDFAAQPGGPATGGERVAVRETAAHGLETVAAVSLRAGVAAFVERATIDWSDADAAATKEAEAAVVASGWTLGGEERVARQIVAFCGASAEARTEANAPTRPTRARGRGPPCAPNCWVAHHADGALGLYAIRDVRKGEPLTFAYAGANALLLLPTRLRRRSLAKLGFECACARCRGEVEDGFPSREALDLALDAARLAVADDGGLPRDLDAPRASATWFANHAYLRGSVPHARAVSAANFVWTRTTALQNGS
ncbi:N,N-dimethylaniline monooxygenase [Aureococcus anophagefferens]|nr:N,N-dimethylaniline monooxygenase [Aureococcus anophagefferens]